MNVKLPTKSELRKGLGYVLINFATPIAFYITFNTAGAKPAITLAIGVTLLQVLVHFIYKMRPSPFFIVASGFTVAFGSIDLFLESPRYFRFEPTVQNLIMGSLLVFCLILKYPIAARFAEALPHRFRPNLSETKDSYLRRLTWIWVFYLYIKSLIFLYLALKVDLGRLILLRTVLGGGSLMILFVGEIVYRKWFRRS